MVHACSDFLCSVTVSKDVLVKDTACPIVPIKEVYHATNNLCEANCIGEGIAGENLCKHMLRKSTSVSIFDC